MKKTLKQRGTILLVLFTGAAIIVEKETLRGWVRASADKYNTLDKYHARRLS